MGISRERFDQGLTVDAFIAQMTRNRERFEANMAAAGSIITTDDLAFFGRHPVSVAVLAEDWCSDAILFVPALVRLAQEHPNVEVRIFPRDEHLDIMDEYLKLGRYRSIPVFVFFDRDWNELGHLIERPDDVTAEIARETRRFAVANPDLPGINRTYERMPEETRKRVSENSRQFREAQKLAWTRRFLDEVKQIIADGVEAATVV